MYARGGVFSPEQRTRISAVVHHTRHPARGRGAFYVIHNPFAEYPLDDAVLHAPGVTQLRVHEDGVLGETGRDGEA